MRRSTRLLLPLAAAAGLVVPMSAHATNTLTYTFAVPCTGGTTSTPLGLGMPTGTYAVTVAGACIVDINNNPRTVGGTPCTVPVAGSVPCAEPVTVDGLTLFGQVSTGGGNDVTTAGVTNFGCNVFSIKIDGNCFAAQAGTYTRTISGAMTVQFVDGNYADNAGELDVTVTWTPL